MRHPRLSLNDFKAMDLTSGWNEHNQCFDVESPHALSQIAGYAKYCLSEGGPVYFRGQAKHYEKMRPSLFRGVATSATADARIRKLRDYIRSQSGSGDIFIKNTPEHAYEPILQHYGFKTRWLDVVDNVWSALWFACHMTHAVGKNDQYLHFDLNKNNHSYIYLMQFGAPEKSLESGLSRTAKMMRVIDLRVAAPSMYLRPHSQHGVLARRGEITDQDMDYSDCVVLVLRIKTEKALEWLGTSPLSQTNFMFPPPTVDQGYKVFLEKGIIADPVLGCIQFIGT